MKRKLYFDSVVLVILMIVFAANTVSGESKTDTHRSFSTASAESPDRSDPFAPLLKEAEPSSKPTPEKSDCVVGNSPLERYDISQLKLAGIVLGPTGKTAIVENAAGKGFVAGMGTPIGLRCGKVIEIQADMIIIREKGEESPKTVRLELRKPPLEAESW